MYCIVSLSIEFKHMVVSINITKNFVVQLILRVFTVGSTQVCIQLILDLIRSGGGECNLPSIDKEC